MFINTGSQLHNDKFWFVPQMVFTSKYFPTVAPDFERLIYSPWFCIEITAGSIYMSRSYECHICHDKCKMILTLNKGLQFTVQLLKQNMMFLVMFISFRFLEMSKQAKHTD